jgi:VanZ family protein
MTLRRFLIVAAWLLLGGIAFVTLSPIGLRPETGLSANAERLVAWLLAGLAFGLAYPRHRIAIAIVLVAAAVGFEVAQHFAIGRHGRVLDAAVKVVGAGVGLAMSIVAERIGRNLRV